MGRKKKKTITLFTGAFLCGLQKKGIKASLCHFLEFNNSETLAWVFKATGSDRKYSLGTQEPATHGLCQGGCELLVMTLCIKVDEYRAGRSLRLLCVAFTRPLVKKLTEARLELAHVQLQSL